MKTLVKCVAIGTVVTLALFSLGYVANELGAETLSYVAYWQAYVIFQLLPCDVVVAPGEFLCQSERVGRIVFYSGIPLGILIYSTVAWVILRLLRRP